jgi:IclR family acetate operon transcriptional repressor
MQTAAPAYSIQSVDNALHLLVMLRRDGVLRVSDAAAELDVARSTAHRLVSMLRFRGFVEQAQDRTYRPGPAFTDFGGSHAWATTLASIARPHLLRLTERTNESSNAVIRAGRDIQFIESAESTQTLRVGARVGVRLSARLTASGKVLLADLPFDQVVALYPDLADDLEGRLAFERTLEVTRRQGFAACFAECERGVAAVAMGVRDATGGMVGAVAIAAPTVRLKQDKVAQLLPALTEAVRNIRADVLALASPECHRPRRATSRPGHREGLRVAL